MFDDNFFSKKPESLTQQEREELSEIERARAGFLPASRYLSKREDAIIKEATSRAAGRVAA